MIELLFFDSLPEKFNELEKDVQILQLKQALEEARAHFKVLRLELKYEREKCDEEVASIKKYYGIKLPLQEPSTLDALLKIVAEKFGRREKEALELQLKVMTA